MRGRIVPLDQPEESPIFGYEFKDKEGDSIVVQAQYGGSVASIDYDGGYMEFTRDEACKLIRALNKVVTLHMPDEDDENF